MDIDQLATHPLTTVGILITAIAALWPFLVRVINDRYNDLKGELDNCHAQHNKASEELAELRGKVAVLEVYSPQKMVTDIVAGVTDALKK